MFQTDLRSTDISHDGLVSTMAERSGESAVIACCQFFGDETLFASILGQV